MKLYGGNGSDTIYGNYNPTVDQYLIGQGDEDTIRTDIYKDGMHSFRTIVFGDWGYGPDDDRYGNTQYGDAALEKKLQGDDDIIIFGDSQDTATSEQIFYAGDGDDQITMGEDYRTSTGYGGRGNDTVYLPKSL